ncbi:hypothetical protein [Chryseobacterium tongliaoense]|uniref:hypothetical protein n=1 Tax=Chryseobacterium tongliaoense TaxID=3240933 RepID=UPI0035123527
MLKKFYKLIIFPYTNLLRIEPALSTLEFIRNTIRWWDIIRIVIGNIVMFIPFGFLGWAFPKLMDLKT